MTVIHTVDETKNGPGQSILYVTAALVRPIGLALHGVGTRRSWLCPQGVVPMAELPVSAIGFA